MHSLHSKPLYGLELICFLAKPGNKCCHGHTFVSRTYKYVCGFFVLHTPAWIGADKLFSNT